MLGDRIAALRGRCGWSQAELAKLLHISASAVGMYEQGRREPSVDVIVSMSRLFGVSIDFLVTGKCICLRDWQAKASDALQGDQNTSLMDAVGMLTKDELVVLLAASVVAGESA